MIWHARSPPCSWTSSVISRAPRNHWWRWTGSRKASSHLSRTGIVGTTLGILRGGYGGMLMFGMLAGMAGITLAAPATLAIGLVMGRRQQRDEKKRQLAYRQQLAKQTYRKYVDAVTFTATKQSRDTLRLVHRELRDQWSACSSELRRSTEAALRAAEHASRAAEMQRDERLADIDAELRRIETLRSRALALGAGSLARASTRRCAPSANGPAAAYVGSPAEPELDAILARLDQPLRVAIAGKVKAGKSTLLNALIGEELAATDAGECTGRHLVPGRPGLRGLAPSGDGAPPGRCRHPRRRGARGRPGGAPRERGRRLDVRWPSSRLRAITLIDTPGIESAVHDGLAADDRLPHPDDDRGPRRMPSSTSCDISTAATCASSSVS